MASWLKWSRSIKSLIFHLPIVSISTAFGAVGLGCAAAALVSGDIGIERNIDKKDNMDYYKDMSRELTYEFNRLLDADPAKLMPEYQRVYSRLGAVKQYRTELDAMPLDSPALAATRKKYIDSAFEVYYATAIDANPRTAEQIAAGRKRLIDRGFMTPMPVVALPVPELYPAPKAINGATATKDEATTYLAQKWLHRENNWTGKEQWVKDTETKLA